MTVPLIEQSAIAPQVNPQSNNQATPKFKFTTQQYHLMHEAGIFKDGDRLMEKLKG